MAPDHVAQDGGRLPHSVREVEQKLFAKAMHKDTPAKPAVLPPEPAAEMPAEEGLNLNWHEDPVESSLWEPHEHRGPSTHSQRNSSSSYLL